MAETVVRSSCRFVLKTSGRESRIEMELFHPTVPALASATLGFEVLGGVAPEQAKALTDMMNDRILGLVITWK